MVATNTAATRTEEIIAFLRTAQGGDMSHAELARKFGCDEGTIRRAKKKADERKAAGNVVELMLGDLCFKYPTQRRPCNDEFTVLTYAAALRAGALFPPIEAVHTPADEWIPWDGFQRIAAGKLAGHTTIKARIREGSPRDAVLLSCGANAVHGLRRDRDTMRNAVLTLMNDAEWSARSINWIAETAAVPYHFAQDVVRVWRGEHGAGNTSKVVGKNGVEQSATKSKPESEEEDEDEDEDDEVQGSSQTAETSQTDRAGLRAQTSAPTVRLNETETQRLRREAREFAKVIPFYDDLAPECRARFDEDVAAYVLTIDIREQLYALVRHAEKALGGVGGLGAKLGPWLKDLSFFLRRPAPKRDLTDSGWLACVDCLDPKTKKITGRWGKDDCGTCKGNGYIVPGLQSGRAS